MPIPNTILYNPAPSYLDDNADPLDAGRIRILNAGTQVLKDLYADNTLNTPIANPVIIGSGGVTTGGVWIPEGNYDFFVDRYIGDHPTTGDPEYANIPSRSRFNISGAGSVGGGGATGLSFVESIDDLRAILPNTTDLVYVAGYYGNDGVGGGFARWNSTATAIDDGGSVFSPNGAPATGRWFRIFETSDIFMEQWGVRVGSSYSNASAVENMVAFAQANTSYRCVFNAGSDDWYLNGNVNVSGDISALVKAGCRFNGLTGSHVLTFSCLNLEIEGETVLANQVPSALLSLSITSEIQVKPQWWGAIEGTVTNSTVYFENCIAQSSDNDILITAPFYIDGVDFGTHKLVKSGLGRLDLGGSPVTLGPIESNSRLFTGVYTNITFTEGIIDGEWFDFEGSIDINQWGDFVDSLSSNGQKVVTWSTGTKIFTSSYSGDVSSLTFEAETDVLFRATGAISVNMPTISTRTHCIDNSGTGVFVFNGRNYISQFGASVGDASSVGSALVYALACGAKIDLEDKTYTFDSSIDCSGFNAEISNGTFVMGGGFTGAYGLKFTGDIRFSNVSINGSTNVGKVLLLNENSYGNCDIRGGIFTGDSTVTLLSDNSAFATYSIEGVTFTGGEVYFINQILGLTIGGCTFDNSLIRADDPSHISITGNSFYRGTSTHSILFSIPLGQTTEQAGFVVTGNSYRSPSRDYFLNVTDANGNFGANYHMKVENNTGTDISSVYEFTTLIDLALGTGTIPVDTLIASTAMINSGFFICTQYNWGSLKTQATTAYVSIVEGAYFDSSTTGAITAEYIVVNGASAGEAYITCSFRRTL